MTERTGNAPVAGATSIILDGDAVHATAPLGAVLRYFDGAPQPPARHTRKLRDWQTRNSTGRLVEKSPSAAMGGRTYPASFVLHEGTFMSGITPVLVVRRHYMVTTDLRFEVLELPQPGMVRVLTRWNGKDELKHLAANMADAESWASRNRYSNLVLQLVEDEPVISTLRRAA